MQKFLTGIPDVDSKEVRDQVKQAHADYRNYIVHLKHKKEEYKQIKLDNDEIRKEMIKEAKIAKSFKFGKMNNKIPFLPALHQRDEGF